MEPAQLSKRDRAHATSEDALADADMLRAVPDLPLLAAGHTDMLHAHFNMP